jgi:hypothetical protein
METKAAKTHLEYPASDTTAHTSFHRVDKVGIILSFNITLFEPQQGFERLLLHPPLDGIPENSQGYWSFTLDSMSTDLQ